MIFISTCFSFLKAIYPNLDYSDQYEGLSHSSTSHSGTCRFTDCYACNYAENHMNFGEGQSLFLLFGETFLEMILPYVKSLLKDKIILIVI